MAYRLRELPGVIGGKRDGPAENEDEGKVSDNQDGYVGVGPGWGEEFLEWRECGHAFVTATDSRPILANTTLASGEGDGLIYTYIYTYLHTFI